MTSAAFPELSPSREEAAARVGGLFERHARMVYGICRAMLRDPHEAEDATQQVFLSAHKALLGGADVRDPGGWLATVARNECRGRIAEGMRRPLAVTDEELDALPAAGDEHVRRTQLDELRVALAGLPERQREAVVLRYLYGLRYGEVAKALELSRPATEALLFRARRALRVSLRPVAGVLVVPAVVREELALALPGFEAKGAGVAAGAGVAGGLLAKLTAGSAGVKVATTAAAVATVGTVGTVGTDRPASTKVATVVVEQREDSPRSARVNVDGTARDDDSSGHGSGRTVDDNSRVEDDDSRGSRDDVVERDTGADRNGPSAATESDDTAEDDRSGSGSSGSSSSGSDSESSGSGSGGASHSGGGEGSGGEPELDDD